MRVAIVGVSHFTAPSGICRYADMLARSASGLGGVRTRLIVAPWQEHYFRNIFKSHLHSELVTAKISRSRLARNAWSLVSLPGLARRWTADLVHLAYPMPFIKKSFRCPVVMTVHDLYPFDSPENFRFPYLNRLILRFALNQAAAVVCVSDSTFNRLAQLLPPAGAGQHIVRIYNPIAVPTLEADQSAVFGLRENRFILTVGQHRRNKNLDILHRSFAQLLNTNQLPADCQLVVVGSEGPETPALMRLRDELGLLQQVRYLSSISDSQLAWLYRNCLVMVVASSHEGFCLPVAEALLSGARVVCSDIPTLREIGSHACTYFKLGGSAVSELAGAAMRSIASPPHTNHDANIFDIGRIAGQLGDVYQQVA